MELSLGPGEMICPKCNGTGKPSRVINGMSVYTSIYSCEKCHGEGKLDFVENVVGKKRRHFNFDSSSQMHYMFRYTSMIKDEVHRVFNCNIT